MNVDVKRMRPDGALVDVCRSASRRAAIEGRAVNHDGWSVRVFCGSIHATRYSRHLSESEIIAAADHFFRTGENIAPVSPDDILECQIRGTAREIKWSDAKALLVDVCRSAARRATIEGRTVEHDGWRVRMRRGLIHVDAPALAEVLGWGEYPYYSSHGDRWTAWTETGDIDADGRPIMYEAAIESPPFEAQDWAEIFHADEAENGGPHPLQALRDAVAEALTRAGATLAEITRHRDDPQPLPVPRHQSEPPPLRLLVTPLVAAPSAPPRPLRAVGRLLAAS